MGEEVQGDFERLEERWPQLDTAREAVTSAAGTAKRKARRRLLALGEELAFEYGKLRRALRQ